MGTLRKLGANVQSPRRERSQDRERTLIAMTVKDVKALTRNSKGKCVYVSELNDTLYELYGLKKIGTKLLSGDWKTIEKLIAKIDLTKLIKILCDNECRSTLRSVILLKRRIASDTTMTDKEVKKAKKNIKKVLTLMSEMFRIEKFKTEDDVSLRDLRTFLTRNESSFYDEWDGYDSDDDDYYEEDRRGPATELQRFVSQHYDRRRDDDDDDIDSWIPPDEDDDDDEEYSSGLQSQIDELGDKMNLVLAALSNSPQAPAAKEAKRKVTAADIGTVLANNTQAIKSMAGAVGGLTTRIDEIDEDINVIQKNLAVVNRVVLSEYSDEIEDDDEDGVAVVSGGGGSIRREEVIDTFAGPTPVKDLPQGG